MIWLKYSIYVLLVLIPVVIAISMYCAAIIVRHRTLIESDYSPEDFGLQYTPFSVNATRDAVLAGWFIPAENSRAVIIASHGVADSKNGILPYLVPYVEAGFSLAVYDLRHHKDSTGKYCSLGYWESRDLLCITEYIRNHFADGQTICYWGFSLGATVSLLAASRMENIAAVIAQSPFVSIHQVVTHYAVQFYHLPPWPIVSIALRFMEWVTGADTGEVNICRIAGKLAEMPILLIGSPDDTQVPLHWLETIQRVLGDSADLLVGPYGHMDLGMHDETYEPERQEIIHSTAFLKNAVSG